MRSETLAKEAKQMKISQMTGRTGKPVANQFILRCDNSGWTYFQSYQTMIAKVGDCGAIYLDKNYWDYSTTTGKYRNQFLNMNKSETEKAIIAGKIQLKDLNQ